MLVTEANRGAWLEERRKSIGASEAAAALGLSPYDTRLSLYLRKLGKLPEQPETEAMRLGNLLEPVLAQLFTERTGRAIQSQQVFLAHLDHPHVTATVDAIDESGEIVEFKTINAFSGRDLGEDGTDQLPDHWLIQAHQQMAVFERDLVHFGVLIGGQKFQTFRVHRNPEIAQSVLDGVNAFWSHHVEPQVPPLADSMDVEVLKRIRPIDGLTTQLDDRSDDLAIQYLKTGEEIKRLKALQDSYKARLLQDLGEAELGVTPTGVEVQRKLTSVREYTVAASERESFHVRTPKPKKGQS